MSVGRGRVWFLGLYSFDVVCLVMDIGSLRLHLFSDLNILMLILRVFVAGKGLCFCWVLL